MTMRTKNPASLALVVGITGLLGGQAASAQAPLTMLSSEPLMKRIVSDAESSRWQWGTFRVQPSLGLGNLSFVDDVFVDADTPRAESQSDLNATVFAGLNFYQILGDNAALAFFVRPQYVWWQDLVDRRRFNLQAGAAAAFDLNRFFFDGELQRVEDQGIATREAEQYINSRRDVLELTAGVPLYRSLALTLGYVRNQNENLLDEQSSALVPDFTRLDSTTETLTAGFRVEPWRNTRIQLAYGEQTSDAGTTSRNFEGDGLTFDLTSNLNAMSITVSLQDFDLVPVGASSFQPYQELTGLVAVTLGTLTGRFLLLQADKGLVASIRSGFDDFESTRYAVTSSTPFGERLRLQLAYIQGERAYRASNRVDDTQRVSASLQVTLIRQAALILRYEYSKVDSTNSAFDRNFNRFTVGFSVGLHGLSWP